MVKGDQKNGGAVSRPRNQGNNRNPPNRRCQNRTSNVDENSNRRAPPNNPSKNQPNASNQTRNSFPIGYMKLKEFMNQYEDADLIVRLSSNTGGFITLLQEPKIAADLLCLILEVLAKVAKSSTDARTRHLQIHFYTNLMPQLNSKTNSLGDHLQKFVATLLSELERNQNQYMKAVVNLLVFLRSLEETILNASIDFVRNIVVPLGGVIDYLNRKGCVFKHESMELFNLTKETIEKFIEKKEEKNVAHDNGMLEEYNPPDDFRQIPICPRAEDIQFDHEQFLAKNIVEGRYASGVDHYLDIQYRLLREDFVRPLREGVTEYIQLFVKDPKKLRKLKKVRDLNIYQDVRIVGSMLKNGEIINAAQFNKESFANVRWQFSKRLLHGSLVCLSPDNFQRSLCFATVALKRDPDKLANGEFYLKFEFSNHLTESITPTMILTMVESPIYFEAYRHNLRVLQSLTPATFPLKEYLIDVSTEIHPPVYLDEYSVFDLSKLTLSLRSTADEENELSIAHKLRFSASAGRCKAVRLLHNPSWPDASDLGFDESQYAAFKAALTQQLAVIQGPPGTGKTYVGLRIAQALLENRIHRFTQTKTSILVVCYTNHALDQFLEGIYAFNKSIVRIGGKSQSDVLEPINLMNVRKENRSIPGFIRQIRWEVRKKIETLQSNIALYEMTINNVMKNIMGHELSSVLQNFNTDHYDQLINYGDFEEALLVFLGYKIIPQNKEAENMAAAGAEAAGIDTIEDEEDAKANGDPDDDNKAEEEVDEEEIALLEAMRIVDDENEDDENRNMNRPEGGNDRNYARINEDADGFSYQKNKKKIRNHIKNQLRSNNCMSIEEANEVKEIWTLNDHNRWRLYRLWVRQYTSNLEDLVKELRRQINGEWKSFEAIGHQMDIELVRQFDVIGMTTTGAAKYHHIIDGIKPHIVIVEEAAEVLEAHIITSLSSCSEHLILIGDHQQLKPSPAVYELAIKYKLEVSLFERLIRNNIAYYQLKKQHRMRPEISSLLVPHIYKELEDHPSVFEYEAIKGVSKNLFFLNHHESESSVNDTSSRMNDHEARFAVELCRYLILQGYKSSQITILTTYSGQLFQIRGLMKKKQSLLYGVRAVVVDNFQGEECDIIILTLVRSNLEGNVGFLKVSNRVNVALSRAKKGLYCIGNFTCLQEKSPLWRDIVRVLQKDNAIGDTMEVYCQNHPDTRFAVAKDADFKQMPEGGCTLPCDARLKCGHTCPSTCHIADREHELINCSKICNTVVCERQHQCRKKCHPDKPCGECNVIVEKLRPMCGHTVKVECSKTTANAYCRNRCEKIRACGHLCLLRCGDNCDGAACGHVIPVKGLCGHEVRVRCSMAKDHNELTSSCKAACDAELKCGHRCQGTCGECYQGRFHKNCSHKCTRILFCEHECNAKTCCVNCPPCKTKCPNRCVHSRCTEKCGQPCAPCKEKCVWRCPHKQCTKLCSEPCNRDLCMEPCQELLKCEHQCIGLCGEECPTLCRVCNKDTVEELFFGTEDEPDARFIQLFDCDHVLEATGLIKWMKTEKDEKENTVIQMKACPKCKTIIRKTKSMNIFISECLTNLNLVKSKVFGNPRKNKDRQRILHEAIKEFQMPIVEHTGTNSTLKILHVLLMNHTKVFQRAPALALPEIIKYENLFEIVKQICLIYNNLVKITVKRGYADRHTAQQFIGRVAQITTFCKSFENSQQQRNDITREIEFLLLVTDTLVQTAQREWNVAGRGLLNQAFELALPLGPVTGDICKRFKELIVDASKLQSGIGISMSEKQMILEAMALAKGHWYKCPNGHVYCIGDCGGATVEANCPECGATVGGALHQLRHDNAIATEMDGATASAWPTNLINQLQPYIDQ